MKPAPRLLLDDEPARLRALQRYKVLDTPREAAFERITRIASCAFQSPVAAITLIDAERQWCKSVHGIDAQEMPRELAFCNTTIHESGPVAVRDAREDPRFSDNPLVTGAPGIRSYLATQLRSPDGYAVGTLCAAGFEPRDFAPAQIELIEDLARGVITELELRLVAQTDDLTGVLTRRGVLTELEREIERATRYQEPLSLLAIDIDHLRAINAAAGHDAGDAVIRGVAEVIQTAIRPTDVVGRLGGEEFLVLLPHTAIADAERAAERLRRMAEQRPQWRQDQSVAASVSIGIAEVDICRDSAATVVARALSALGEAKAEGRNRFVSRLTRQQRAQQDVVARGEACRVGFSLLS